MKLLKIFYETTKSHLKLNSEICNRHFLNIFGQQHPWTSKRIFFSPKRLIFSRHWWVNRDSPYWLWCFENCWWVDGVLTCSGVFYMKHPKEFVMSTPLEKYDVSRFQTGRQNQGLICSDKKKLPKLEVSKNKNNHTQLFKKPLQKSKKWAFVLLGDDTLLCRSFRQGGLGERSYGTDPRYFRIKKIASSCIKNFFCGAVLLIIFLWFVNCFTTLDKLKNPTEPLNS